ncbi:MAG TPA: metal-sulfur cluster assembly factor [Actinomycetota bacterium]|jgi:metal-sulfur cluster biosynthetic enzyme|nr:metal-sulfur cluster assembly factor [Actinomycetota bacterium]
MNEASEQIQTDEFPDTTAVEPAPGDTASAIGNGPAADGDGDGVTKEGVLEALKAVLDPELGINIVDLGLVYDVEIADGHVHVTYTLTTMGCPIGPLVEAQMHQLLDPLPGIDSFDAEMVLRPPWTPEMMSEEAKEALGYF